MFKSIINFLNYHLESFKLRPPSYSLTKVIIRADNIYIEYKLNVARLSQTQQKTITEIENLQTNFNRNDRLKIDACLLASELIESMKSISHHETTKQKILNDFYPKLANYLKARLEL
ncbi:hypothetical protein [Facilibium subflavum]|uniref:hypothetical protein n=1 Tax=Facilibium subflavum TaxID=2219058 RepID=UPI000E656B14|nr:hypothetical protein [Facilibium subflavum]